MVGGQQCKHSAVAKPKPRIIMNVIENLQEMFYKSDKTRTPRNITISKE